MLGADIDVNIEFVAFYNVVVVCYLQPRVYMSSEDEVGEAEV
jgi:hypothetical protein